ncbi:MAG: VOC family protein [Acidimicrobiia bacterium]|nr:VOC family protein [Acidimicrobiia bacterium]
MKLGAFSISLSVAELERSRAFYASLGFEVTGGDAEQGWLILKNGDAIVGLFHGLFEGNILTFNPGLGQDTRQTDDYTDVREIQIRLEEAGIELIERVDPDSTGAGHITLVDPDGNAILIDQFF